MPRSSRHAALLALSTVALAACLRDTTGIPPSDAIGLGVVANVGAPIAGRWIVSMTDSVAPSALADVLGGAVLDTLDVASQHPAAIRSGVPGGQISLALSDSLVALLRGDPRVASIDPDIVTGAMGSVSNPPGWALDRIDQRTSTLDLRYGFPNVATGVTIYVVDSGILAAHTEFGSRASLGPNFDATAATSADCNGHGTSVASAAAGATLGLARGANIVAIRTQACDGSGAAAAVASALDWVTANGVRPAVINLSLGTNNVPVPAIRAAVLRAIAAGFTLVAAAGNANGIQCDMYPQSMDYTINVGATAANDARASFSNFGPCISFFAPGANVLLASMSGTAATALTNGTSFAAPYTAGAAAQYLARFPTATGPAVKRALQTLATRSSVSSAGSGTANPNLLYVPSASTGFDALPPRGDTLTLVKSASYAVSSFTLAENDAVTPILTIAGPDGQPLGGRKPVFATSQPLVATVAPTGRVTAVGQGTARITAYVDGRTATTTVSVTQRHVAAVTLALANATVPVGTTVPVTLGFADSSGRTLPVRGRGILLESSNAAVGATPYCTVSSTGVLQCFTRGLARGTAVLALISPEGLRGTATLTVYEVPASILLTPGTAQRLVVGTTLQMSASVRGASGVQTPSQTVTWTSSDTNVASISAGGLVTAGAAGSVTIAAQVGLVKAQISLIVTSQ
jgi:subtilisin family serine protease